MAKKAVKSTKGRAVRAVTPPIERPEARQRALAVYQELRGLERQVKALRGRVEGATRLDEVLLAFCHLDIKAAMTALCPDGSVMCPYD
jgi:hypothetical protein